MRTIVHVGAHKTGTSLIQKYFRDKLSVNEESSLGYVPRHNTNWLIGWGQHLQNHPERLHERLAQEFARHDMVFVSHENTIGHPFVPGRPGLYPDAPELAKSLASIVEPFDTGIAFFIRPLADFVESYYLQTVHQGATHTFEQWWSTIDGSQVRWAPIVTSLQDVFGAERLILGDFRRIAEGQNEFLRAFLERCGFPVPKLVDYRPIRNASVSAVGFELAMKMNPYLETKQQRRAARTFVQKYFSNRTGERARPMPDAVREQLDAQGAAEYEQLAAAAR